jgi:hypothetical protein
MTELGLTSKCSATSRREAPDLTASIARCRKSSEYGLGIEFPPANQTAVGRMAHCSQVENPIRFDHTGIRSKSAQRVGIDHKRRVEPTAYLGRKPSYTRKQLDRILSALSSTSAPSLSTIARAEGLTKQTVYCGIRANAATDSDGKRPPNPLESGHLIRTKPATLLMG